MKVEIYSGKHTKTIELNDVTYYAALGFILATKTPISLIMTTGSSESPHADPCGSIYSYCGDLRIALMENYEELFNNFEKYTQIFPMWDITWGLYVAILDDNLMR